MTADLYVRPALEDDDVQRALERWARAREVRDVGGTMSLNLHVVDEGVVLRVHPRFVVRKRVDALQAVRHRLLAHGLVVAEPIACDQHEGGRVTEVETYLEGREPPPTPDSYRWMFEAMGRLHSALATFDASDVPPPGVATWGPPTLLDEQLALTAAAVAGDLEAAALAAHVRGLAELLAEQWIDESRLPNHLIHGDVRLGNVVAADGDGDGEAVYFDFGFMAVRPRVFDLAYSLSWIVLRPDDRGTAEEFDWSLAEDFIAAYESNAGATLTSLERRALWPYLASVPLYLASIAGHTPDPAARILVERPFLAIAEWLLRHRP